MKLLIVEDERPIANYIERLCHTILGDKIKSITTLYALRPALTFLFEHQIDLCLLDLNLNGENGYNLLKLAVASSFHTIIISANSDQAIEAFKYNVVDFIPKPFDDQRLGMAFKRYFERIEKQELATQYLPVRKNRTISVLKIDDVLYFKAADIYVEAHLKNGKTELLDKTMGRLEQILPSRFLRIHRSYFVDISQVAHYEHIGGGTYQVVTKKGQSLPLCRQKYKELQELLHH